ncbi:MAG: TetR/AcrR family transcriptional regulator C-terminal domain-containing protein [Ruminococcus sp.]|nr:TetR/AcrR family transcriptional regulator C-terminal domain-containing protein [Ruminococcus sp.]
MKHEVTSMYTKKALSDKLKKLMETKPFSKITVSELIAECGLNRKTFYYHFQDMRDLLRWTLREEAIDVVKHFDLANDYESAIIFVVEYLEQNQHMLNCVYDSVGRDELKLYLYEDLTDIAKMIISAGEKNMHKNISEEYKKLLIMFYTEGITGIIIEWLHGKIKMNKSDTVKYISEIFRGSLTGLIENAE